MEGIGIITIRLGNMEKERKERKET